MDAFANFLIEYIFPTLYTGVIFFTLVQIFRGKTQLTYKPGTGLPEKVGFGGLLSLAVLILLLFMWGFFDTTTGSRWHQSFGY